MSATSDPAASPVSATNTPHATPGYAYLVVNALGGVPVSIHATEDGAESAARGMPGGFRYYSVVFLTPREIDRINAIAGRTPSPSPVAAADPAPGDPEAAVLAKPAKATTPDTTPVPPLITKGEHTPGRAVYHEGSNRIVDANGNVLALCYYGDRPDRQVFANARRIYALWNACADLPTDVLELIGGQQSPTERLAGLYCAAKVVMEPIAKALTDEDCAAVKSWGEKFVREMRLLLRNAQSRQPGQAQPLVDR